MPAIGAARIVVSLYYNAANRPSANVSPQGQAWADLSGVVPAAVVIEGTFTGSATFECSLDGTTWRRVDNEDGTAYTLTLVSGHVVNISSRPGFAMHGIMRPVLSGAYTGILNVIGVFL